MTSLGRLIFFDQPGTGASDPVTSGALPTLEQWADSITAVLDDLGSREAVLVASMARSRQRRCSRRHIRRAPPRWSCSTVTQIRASTALVETNLSCYGRACGARGDPTSGKSGHAVERGDPGNLGTTRTSGGQPRNGDSHDAAVPKWTCGRCFRQSGCQPSSSTTPTTCSSRPRRASTSPSTYPTRSTLSCRAATATTSLNRGAPSFQEIAQFLTGQQAEVADDRVLATVLFTDIVDSTRRAAEMGDRDWHALLDAHDAVVRAQLSRFRGREVNTSGDGFLAMFDGPQRAIRCAMAIRDAVQALGIEVRAGLHTGECEVRGDDIGGIGVHIGARVSALAGPNDVLVSSTLRDLVIGSGLEFEDRGAHQLKGVPGEWRLFAVASP